MSLAKLIIDLLIPLGTLLFLLLGGLWALTRDRRALTAVALIFALLLIWGGGLPATARWTAGLLEHQYPLLEIERAPEAQAIVVLGGGVALPTPQAPVTVGPTADRAWFGSLLHRADKAPLILISGGGEPPEAPLIKELMTGWGVPADRIAIEPASLNTRENANESRRMLAAQGIDEILLVTSAMHMPRAAAAFSKSGFQVRPFPVGFRSLPPVDTSPRIVQLLPNADALAATSEALLELVAWAYYRLRGWV